MVGQEHCAFTCQLADLTSSGTHSHIVHGLLFEAYVCCSGLPKKDKDHARNVANFAIAVKHCCRHVLSPVDGAPIKLRIGVNTGPAVSGVVRTLNPPFCVFGDTVNTTARHESSGLPDMIHCSGSTRTELQQQHSGLFQVTERGKVEMKGKGQLTTYWLDGHENNSIVNHAALQQLDVEVKNLLSKTNFKTKMGLEAHPSFIEVRQEREKRNQRLMTRDGSSISFGSTPGSTSSLGSFHRRRSSCSMARSGSTLRRIPLAQVVARTTVENNYTRRISDDCSRQKVVCGGPLDSTDIPLKRKAANAEWGTSSTNSSSTGSHETKKQRNLSNESLHLLERQTKDNTCHSRAANDKVPTRVINLNGGCMADAMRQERRDSNKLFAIVDSCKDAAMEDSMGNMVSRFSFPEIPDTI